ncbi:HAMP domain-containing sensor histidine kinase [Deltaproteobacteria bacterium TL4]
MNHSKWIFHPFLILIYSIVALSLSLILYIYWYMEISAGLEEVALKFNLDPAQVLNSPAWVVILVLSILVGIIFTGIFVIYVYNQKTSHLYLMQRKFINNFTHELKTPVTSIKLYLETFLKHELPRADQTKYIGYMIQDVDRLTDNINRILNLARIESKTYGGEFRTLDLFEFITHFCKNNQHLFPNCEINIHNPLNRSCPYPINPSLFEMLLMNLLSNSVKYNESTTPIVDITFELTKNRLCLYFEDNGIGIENSERKKIFKLFYQGVKAHSMNVKGSGLGLYLVQNITQIHKGTITAKVGKEGRGALFTLSFPMKPGG